MHSGDLWAGYSPEAHQALNEANDLKRRVVELEEKVELLDKGLDLIARIVGIIP